MATNLRAATRMVWSFTCLHINHLYERKEDARCNANKPQLPRQEQRRMLQVTDLWRTWPIWLHHRQLISPVGMPLHPMLKWWKKFLKWAFWSCDHVHEMAAVCTVFLEKLTIFSVLGVRSSSCPFYSYIPNQLFHLPCPFLQDTTELSGILWQPVME